VTSRISRYVRARSSRGAHRGRVCLRVFIGVSVRACFERLHCTVYFYKKKSHASAPTFTFKTQIFTFNQATKNHNLPIIQMHITITQFLHLKSHIIQSVSNVTRIESKQNHQFAPSASVPARRQPGASRPCHWQRAPAPAPVRGFRARTDSALHWLL
jgi:hypothetical protein